MLQSRVKQQGGIASQVGLELARESPAEEEDGSGLSRADPGIQVDYCIFCYHGGAMLRHDNTALLSKFVSERGAILPKRFTKCCPRHQRALALTIKRSRSLAVIPFHAKLHPAARFSSFSPPAPTGRREALTYQTSQRVAGFTGNGGDKGVSAGEAHALIKELAT